MEATGYGARILMDARAPTPRVVVPNCPTCRGAMEMVHDRPELKECACQECGTRITITTKAWEAARQFGCGKRELAN